MGQSSSSGKLQARPLDEYSPEDQAFYKFWYAHMLDDLMQPPLAEIAYSTARYIWDASQPKDPAPVLVVQGEAVSAEQVLQAIQSCGSELSGRIALTYEGGPTVVAMKLARAIQSVLTTPVNMAVGAVGGVGARIVVQARKLLTELDDYFKRTKTLDVNVAYRCDKLERALNATPAPEQADTGSGDSLKSAFDEGYQFGHRDGMEDCRPMGGSGYGLASCWEDSETRFAILSTASPAGEGEVKL